MATSGALVQRPKSTRAIQDVLDEIVELSQAAGTQPLRTAIPGVVMVKGEVPARQLAAIYEPMIGFTAQGTKLLSIGGREVELKAPCYYVIPTHLPATARVRPGSGGRPYLSIGLALEREPLEELLRADPSAGSTALVRGFGACPASIDYCEAWLRLLRLLRNPREIPALAPIHKREIYYRVLTGPHGPRLRLFLLKGGPLARITETANWIRKHYDETIDARVLAEKACMATTTFHRQFKRATGLSPIQFQKQLRLLEARNLMAFQGESASSAAFDVGYQSPSQFNREYSRFFGETPARDAALYRRLGPQGGSCKRPGSDSVHDGQPL